MKRSDPCALRRFGRERSGLAAIEFALFAPLLVLIFIGLIEASNYVYSNQKVESAAANVLNITNQQAQLSLEDLRRIAEIVPEVAVPNIVRPSDYRVIFTAVQRDKPSAAGESQPLPYVLWQESFGNRSLGESALRYQTGGGKQQNALRPGDLRDLSFTPGDQVIAVEVYMRYAPTIETGFSPHYDRSMYYLNFSRPRKGAFSVSPRDKSEQRQ